MERTKDYIFSSELGSIRGNEFNSMYPRITEHIITGGDLHQSRYGNTRRVKDFKTEILNPRYRVVGGYGRNANVYFLIAEAMWIWLGRRDVHTLVKYNSRMKDFSDDGNTFHGAYGHRLRREAKDQLAEAINILSNDPNTRRCVLQIWDAEKDLGAKSKDIPCNDLLMFDLDKGALNLTVANRSNDLHWGLTTNVFQFSFMSEWLSKILDVELGRQTHNSKDLHIYMDNVTTEMMAGGQEQSFPYSNIYHQYQPSPFQAEFLEGVENKGMRLKMLDKLMSQALDVPFSHGLVEHSKTLAFFNQLLSIYATLNHNKEKGMGVVERHIKALDQLELVDPVHEDMYAMAQNFHARRLLDKGVVYFSDSIEMGRY